MFVQSVLIFNENKEILSALVKSFQSACYAVTPIDQPGEVLNRLRFEKYDLLILDTCPTGWEGDQFLANVRRISTHAPIVVLTHNPCLETAIQALHYKVADYLDIATPIEELHKRIQEVLLETRMEIDHRSVIEKMQALLDTLRPVESKTFDPVHPESISELELGESIIVRGPYRANLTTREVYYGNKHAVLSPTEFCYWVALLRHQPEVISYRLLVKEAHNYELGSREAMNLARWHIHGLRKVFEAEWGKDPIQTIRGVGYKVLV